ncbi:MAG: ComF family protein [Eubacterium sp.]|nr:ComF family protein [Eubacterium sp.]
MSELKRALSKILKVLFPNRCSICGEVIELDTQLCDNCTELPVIEPPLCEFCGSSKEACNCKKRKNEFKQIAAPYYYTDSIVIAIHRFKNSDMPFLAKRLGEDVAKCVIGNYGNIDFDMITFVPLRHFRECKRGYNQSELLADIVSDKINVEVFNLLVKVRYTGVQHHKKAAQRAADVFGSYDVIDEYKNQLDGKTILLIDDVKTTGSTLNECAKMLKIYGANSVYCAAVAVTKKTDKNK